MAYGEQPPGFFKWGASVAELDSGIIGIKLLLDPEQERPTYLPSTNAQRDIRMLPKQPVEIAADFMGAIYKHALDEISKTVPKAYMDLCSKEFVLSGKWWPSLFMKQMFSDSSKPQLFGPMLPKMLHYW